MTTYETMATSGSNARRAQYSMGYSKVLGWLKSPSSGTSSSSNTAPTTFPQQSLTRNDIVTIIEKLVKKIKDIKQSYTELNTLIDTIYPVDILIDNISPSNITITGDSETVSGSDETIISLLKKLQSTLDYIKSFSQEAVDEMTYQTDSLQQIGTSVLGQGNQTFA